MDALGYPLEHFAKEHSARKFAGGVSRGSSQPAPTMKRRGGCPQPRQPCARRDESFASLSIVELLRWKTLAK